jgi:hypothetical protein
MDNDGLLQVRALYERTNLWIGMPKAPFCTGTAGARLLAPQRLPLGLDTPAGREMGESVMGDVGEAP